MGNGWGVRPFFGGHYWFVLHWFICPIGDLQCSTAKLQIFGTASLLNACQTPYHEILFVAVFGKEFCTNARMFRWRKAFSFHLRHFLLSFASWVNLKMLTLDFELSRKTPWFFSEIHCEFETKRKQFQISRISWAHQQWRHEVYFRLFSPPFNDCEG